MGKIPNASLDAFLAATEKVERPQISSDGHRLPLMATDGLGWPPSSQVERPQFHEADLLEYFDQAIALRHALLFLRSDPACAINGSLRPLDIVRTESLATLDGATRARVLQRQYALLVSMAPMEPLCEHVYTAGLPVMHFGPTFSLLTSPWLQLALYTALGCGPPSILLPRGARLRRVPEGLRPYSHLLLTPWGGEPAVTSTSHLLSVAAELLTRAPLLVQAYVADASAGTARLPMPVADAAETPKAATNLGQNLGQNLGRIADAPETPRLESPPAATPSPAMPTGEGSTRTDTEAEGAPPCALILVQAFPRDEFLSLVGRIIL